MTTPWVEKYRPRTVDDVAHQDDVVGVLKKSLTSANLPHLLFYGPPGTGKTSTILAVARELFGPDLMSKRVLELNASDDRGISAVREKIKTFAQTTVSHDTSSPYPCPPYKIIILDECDTMTQDAQTALRRTIEKFSRETRFCLICNYISRIIDPLTSRCAKFRFQPLPHEKIRTRLTHICESEGLEISVDVLDQLISDCHGDMRKAIITLQSVHRLFGKSVTSAAVIEVSGRIPPELISNFLRKCRVEGFDQIQRFVSDTLAEGYSAFQFLEQLLELVVTNGGDVPMSDLQITRIAERIAKTDASLVAGCAEEIQLMNVAALVMDVWRDNSLIGK
eukprot:c7303_g1_i1.p1 GENE.c7303_g1_i1~~c7303_g1_i1.p1  ORF type:complete len:352 (+),score=76.84 c7303_g1_i1:51-1058(+)